MKKTEATKIDQSYTKMNKPKKRIGLKKEDTILLMFSSFFYIIPSWK